jgi:predicted nucleic acid-binding protein
VLGDSRFSAAGGPPLVQAELRRRGRPIPRNDLWNAAMVLEHGLVLYSRDACFAEVPGLARL